jgi:hypothetical protein
LSRYVRWARANNSPLILTWDDDDHSASNRIPTVLVGAHVKAGTHRAYVNHNRILRTLEASYGLPLLIQARSYTPVTVIWQ